MDNIETLLAAVAQTQGFDDAPTPSVNNENSDALPPIAEASGNAQPVTTPPIAAISASEQLIGVGEKRKRGRPPKGQAAAKSPPPPPKRKKLEDEEEDVCFICFDGGSLVLCDRKGCPKAYHPTCIKRDEAFFKSKAKWNCGWHICSVCQKASHYMCYTCTYSLCKGCTKKEDYVCVRGNKGFCSTCMGTIMLLENKDQVNNESVKVDFDDKTSFEYLFKVYWVILKEKLSLTLSELTQAKPPTIVSPTVACKPRFRNGPYPTVDVKVPISSMKSKHLELNDELRTTPSGFDNPVDNGNNNDIAKPNADKVIGEPGIKKDEEKSRTVDTEPTGAANSTTKWASKDLLEFVGFMRNGDASAMSSFDVQKLLLDYIKRSNLRDPRQKSQIICDQRLKNLFGKPRVGHIEMLKLLEFHFPVDDSQNNSLIPAGFVVASDAEIDGKINSFPMTENSRKRKTRKRNEERAPQNNLHEYAAIDAHNINLIYLRRNLMENLLQDQENFDNKVIGSLVRIRTSSNDQKQDIYRLVQVVGTVKVAEPYKIGERTANVMLEVLNLYKREVVSIDAISNQEFTEDECQRLRQSIRYGFVKRLTVGEVQKIALAIQPVRIKDWLEGEILRLNHLRDRASENGRKKELREYVDKLEVLKSPEEQQRRIAEVPEIHADPKMSPNYESDEEEEQEAKSGDNRRKVACVRPSYSGFPQNGRNPVSPSKKGKKEQYIHSRNRTRQKTNANGVHGLEKSVNQVNSSNLKTGGKNDEAVQRTGLETSTTTTASVENTSSANNIETEKLWHYRDPNGKIQGPFSMMQLRKWNTTGLFPTDMRIWTNHEQYDSLLLTDALIRHLHGASETSFKQESRENAIPGGISDSKSGIGSNGNQTPGFVNENTTDSSWPQSWDLLNDSSSTADNAQERNVLPLPGSEFDHETQNKEKNSSEPTQIQPNEENLKSLNIDLSSTLVESESVVAPVPVSTDLNKQVVNIDLCDLHSPTLTNAENPPSVSGFLELLSPTPRLNNEDETEAANKQSGILNFPDVANEWRGYSPTPIKPSIEEWDSNLASASVTTISDGHQMSQPPPSSNTTNWLDMLTEPIVFDALSEELISDLFAEADAKAQGAMHSPIKSTREFLEDCKDDCFSSIEDFNPTPNPASGSTGEIQLTSQSSCNPIDIDSFRKSSVNSSASSEGETNAQVYSGDAGSEFHPPNNPSQDMFGHPSSGPDPGSDPGWGTVQGNINLVTVQGNVNLVLGGPNLNWGTNPGTAWGNPSINHSPRNGSLPWDSQRKYGGERFTSPRQGYQGSESGFGRGRPPRGRLPYNGGGYSRVLPKGQRVCKFYESGHCKKGAFCDYLHP